MGVQGVRWDKVSLCEKSIIFFSKEKGKENHKLGTEFFVHYRIVSAVNRVEFVSDRISYLALIGRWCNFVLLSEDDST
jgi:hypothetical protein